MTPYPDPPERPTASSGFLAESSSRPAPPAPGYRSPSSDPGFGWSEPPPEPPAGSPVQEERPLWKRALGGAAAIGLLVAKFAAKLKFLLLILPKLKFAGTFITALISIGLYTAVFGLPFAVGIVLLIFVHEMGHVIQLRREGIKATAPMFIPFFGAFVGMKQRPHDAAMEARVGLAGPILGSLAAVVPLLLYRSNGSHLFLALAYFGFFINLINLLPVLPLDGGRAMAALTPWMWFVGYGVLLGLGIAFRSPIVLLILILGGFETYRRWKARKQPGEQAYYRVAPRTRVAVGAVYLGLAALLFLGMYATVLPAHPTA